MADTGAPHFIPYIEPSDLVRDYPAADKAQAEAVADALDAAGGLVAVKSADFTGTQTNSTATGANFAVTDLTITHAMADAGNKLIISAFFGQASNSKGEGSVGLAIHDGTSLINVGASPGSRTPVSAGGLVSQAANYIVTMPSIRFVHVPGDTASRTYTVRAINIATDTRTITINTSQVDTDSASFSRAVSGFVIEEVSV